MRCVRSRYNSLCHNTIYNKIEEMDDFTIKGYEVSIKNDSKKTDLKFYVLDKEIFKSIETIRCVKKC